MWINQKTPEHLAGRFTKVDGDRWALIRWSLLHGPLIEESNEDLGRLMAEVPHHLDETNDERLSVCEVLEHVVDNEGDPTDYIPTKIVTLYELDWYADPEEQEA